MYINLYSSLPLQVIYHYKYRSEEEYYIKSCVRGDSLLKRGDMTKCGHRDFVTSLVISLVRRIFFFVVSLFIMIYRSLHSLLPVKEMALITMMVRGNNWRNKCLNMQSMIGWRMFHSTEWGSQKYKWKASNRFILVQNNTIMTGCNYLMIYIEKIP